MVMVTHHVEEIPPGFTHALLLAEGEVQASGPIAEVITGENLSDTFGLRARRVDERERALRGPRRRLICSDFAGKVDPWPFGPPTSL